MRVEKEAWPSVPDSLDPVVHELIGHWAIFLALKDWSCWQLLLWHRFCQKMIHGGNLRPLAITLSMTVILAILLPVPLIKTVFTLCSMVIFDGILKYHRHPTRNHRHACPLLRAQQCCLFTLLSVKYCCVTKEVQQCCTIALL
jgi:hypothetical protein